MIWFCFKQRSLMARVSNGSNSEQHKLEFLSLEVELQEEEKARSPDTYPLLCLKDLYKKRNIRDTSLFYKNTYFFLQKAVCSATCYHWEDI